MRSKDAQVLMAVGSNWLGVNRYVFKRCLNAWTLWHSWTSVGREFQMKGVTTLKTRRVRSVWVWGTTISRWSQRPCRNASLHQVTQVQQCCCAPHFTGYQSHFVCDLLPCWKPVQW